MSDGATAHLVLAALLAAPLIYAATSKIMDPRPFLNALPRLHTGLPARHTTATLVGSLEAVTGIGLLVVSSWLTAAAATALYLAFAVVIERARRLGSVGDCGCFGTLRSRVDLNATLRNVSLCAVSGLITVARGVGALHMYPVPEALPLLVGTVLLSAGIDTWGALRSGR